MTDPFAEIARSHDARAAARTARQQKALALEVELHALERRIHARRTRSIACHYADWRVHQTADPLSPPTEGA
jgi:hypothetical protein